MTFPHLGQVRIFMAKVGVEDLGLFEAMGDANVIVYILCDMIYRQISGMSAI